MASEGVASRGGEGESEPQQDPKRVAEMEQWRDDLRVLIRCLRDSQTPWYASALMLGVLAWGAIPVDPLPDFIPLAGIVDDATVFLIVRMGVYSVIPNEVVEFHTEVVAEKSRFKLGPMKVVASIAVLQILVMGAILAGVTSVVM